MIDFIASLGFWNWFILSFVLLTLELLVSGFFLVWFGIGALVTAALALFVGDYFLFDRWQMQVFVFLILSTIALFLGRYMVNKMVVDDEPHLNQRTNQLIGYATKLDKPIVNGQGWVRIDDTIWRVSGPDAAAGSVVELVDFKNGAFIVKPFKPS